MLPWAGRSDAVTAVAGDIAGDLTVGRTGGVRRPAPSASRERPASGVEGAWSHPWLLSTYFTWEAGSCVMANVHAWQRYPGGWPMQIDTILAELQSFSSLATVIPWAMSRQPRAEFVDVVVQDEFNHDVIVRIASTVYAVFETS